MEVNHLRENEKIMLNKNQLAYLIKLSSIFEIVSMKNTLGIRPVTLVK
jgi:hypothetical protein